MIWATAFLIVGSSVLFALFLVAVEEHMEFCQSMADTMAMERYYERCHNHKVSMGMHDWLRPYYPEAPVEIGFLDCLPFRDPYRKQPRWLRDRARKHQGKKPRFVWEQDERDGRQLLFWLYHKPQKNMLAGHYFP